MEKVTIGNADLYCGDCAVILPQLEPVDLILTDPPYGINISANPVRQKHDKMDWDAAPPPAWIFGLMENRSKHQIIWGGNYFSLKPTRAFLVWDKMQPENFSLAMCEQAWCDFDANAKIYRQSVTSYQKEHPTQKPDRLMEWCIRKCPDEPQTICDPFMGSGSTGVAAMNLEKQFIGIERERKYFDIACERISQAQAQGRLAI